MSEIKTLPLAPLDAPVGARPALPEADVATMTMPPADGHAEGHVEAFERGWAETSRYALVSELARGGGGRVAVAIDRKLGRRVALKRPLDMDGGARLEQEALVLARLEHPSIVPIHDAGRDGTGNPFYTMKLVDGETVGARIDRARTFEERLVLLPTLTAVAGAMAYAHAQGVIHRDLKPSNVVVGAFGEVAVIDWGLGKVIDAAAAPQAAEDRGVASPLDARLADGLTGVAQVIGTPAYMAPEQARGEPVDRRADVYALGAMLYHVLTGAPPYPRGTTDQTLALLRTSPPPPVEEREPRVPRDLAAIVHKAMSWAAEQRYPSAGELAEDLRRYEAGRLVAAHHYSLATRAWRWCRRHRAALALGAGALALAGTATFWVAADRAAPPAPCLGLDAPVRAAWSPAIAAAIAPRFTTTPAPGALATWRTLAVALDARATAIASLRVGACQAAHVTGELSASALDLKMTCLDRRTAELAHFVAWLGAAEPSSLGKALDGQAALGRTADCDDVTRLHDIAPMPSAPAARAVIAAIDGELDEVVTRSRDGHYAEADRASADLVERARRTGYAPVLARALYLRTQVLLLQTKTPETLALAAEALVAAEAAGADRLRADVLTLQLHVELNTLQHLDAADALAAQVVAIAARVQDPQILSAALGYRAQIELMREHIPAGVALAEQALAQIREPDGPDGWAARSRLASAYAMAHRRDDAVRILTALVASRRAIIGDADDPNLANNLANLAALADDADDKPRAIALMTEATGMLDRTLPVDAKARLEAHTNLAALEGATGRYAEELAELERLLPVAEGKLGHDHRVVADIAFRIAEARDHLHDKDGAVRGYRDALARYTAAAVPLWVAKCHGHIGTVLLDSGHAKEALPELTAAYVALSALRGPTSADAALWRGDIGRAKLQSGDARGALADLVPAMAALDPEGDPIDRGILRVSLAAARWRLGDHPGALAAAAEAKALFQAAGADGADGLADLAEWERTR